MISSRFLLAFALAISCNIFPSYINALNFGSNQKSASDPTCHPSVSIGLDVNCTMGGCKINANVNTGHNNATDDNGSGGSSISSVCSEGQFFWRLFNSSECISAQECHDKRPQLYVDESGQYSYPNKETRVCEFRTCKCDPNQQDYLSDETSCTYYDTFHFIKSTSQCSTCDCEGQFTNTTVIKDQCSFDNQCHVNLCGDKFSWGNGQCLTEDECHDKTLTTLKNSGYYWYPNTVNHQCEVRSCNCDTEPGTEYQYEDLRSEKNCRKYDSTRFIDKFNQICVLCACANGENPVRTSVVKDQCSFSSRCKSCNAGYHGISNNNDNPESESIFQCTPNNCICNNGFHVQPPNELCVTHMVSEACAGCFSGYSLNTTTHKCVKN